MTKTILLSSEVATPAGIMSQGVSVPAGRMVFASGQVARGVDGQLVGRGDIRAQTRKVLETPGLCWPRPAPPWTTWSR